MHEISKSINIFDRYRLICIVSKTLTGKELNWKDELFVDYAHYKVKGVKHYLFEDLKEMSLFELMKILAEMEQ